WPRLDSSFFFSSRRRHTRSKRDWSSDVCSSDLSADDGWDAVDKFFAGRKPPYSVALDRGAIVSRSWGTTKFPESYLVDASGNLRSEERRVRKEWRGGWAADT